MDFRRSFYSALRFDGPASKAAIDAALQEDAPDRDVMRRLCLVLSLPHMYRVLVWKVVLGVLPTCKELWAFTELNHREQVADLASCVVALFAPSSSATRIENNAAPLRLVRMMHVKLGNQFLQMRKMEMKSAEFKDELIKQAAIASVMLELCENEVDAFWLLFTFLSARPMTKNIESELATQFMTSFQNTEPTLHAHYLQIKFNIEIVCRRWFQTFFAECVPAMSLSRIWDIVVGGDRSVLLYLALSILHTFRRRLLSFTTLSEMHGFMRMFPTDDMDNVVNRAIDQWRKVALAEERR